MGIPCVDGENGDTTLAEHSLVLDREHGLGAVDVVVGNYAYLKIVTRVVAVVHRTHLPGELQLVGVVQVELG